MNNKKTLCTFCNNKTKTEDSGVCYDCKFNKIKFKDDLQDAFDSIIDHLQATANNFYGPNDKMWNTLLKSRDTLQIKFDKEIRRLER